MATDPKAPSATKADVTADPAPVPGSTPAPAAAGVGDPTDPTAPPWAVHKSPVDQKAAAREAKRLDELQSSVQGEYYLLAGTSPGDGTVAVKTNYGELNDHTPIKLPEDAVDSLKASGFRLKKVDAPQ